MQLNDQKAAKNKTNMKIHTKGSNFILSLILNQGKSNIVENKV